MTQGVGMARRSAFVWGVAWRFFKSSGGEGGRLMSFISMLAMTGLVMGIALMIVVTAVMNGFDREMQERILGIVPHIRLFTEEGIADWQSAHALIEKDDRVAAVYPESQVEGLLVFRGKVEPLQLSGYLFEEGFYPDFVHLHEYVAADRLVAGDGLLLGAGLAKRLGVAAGDRVSVMVPSEAGNSDSLQASRLRGFSVVGIVTTHTEVDQLLAISSLEAAAALSAHAHPVHGLRVALDDAFAARTFGYDQLAVLPKGYRFTDWFHTHGNLYQAIRVSKQMVGLLVVLIIAVAAFNVVSMLVMSVSEKRSAIAILKTLGAERGTIMRIFLCQGLLIGLGGCVMGGLLGTVLAWNISDVAAWLQSALGMQLLDTQVYPVDYLPSVLRWLDVAAVLATALALTFLATLYPAWRAVRVLPAEELRYE